MCLWNAFPVFYKNFQAGEVYICFGNDKFFGLTKVHIYSRNMHFLAKWGAYNMWKS